MTNHVLDGKYPDTKGGRFQDGVTEAGRVEAAMNPSVDELLYEASTCSPRPAFEREVGQQPKWEKGCGCVMWRV